MIAETSAMLDAMNEAFKQTPHDDKLREYADHSRVIQLVSDGMVALQWARELNPAYRGYEQLVQDAAIAIEAVCIVLGVVDHPALSWKLVRCVLPEDHDYVMRRAVEAWQGIGLDTPDQRAAFRTAVTLLVAVSPEKVSGFGDHRLQDIYAIAPFWSALVLKANGADLRGKSDAELFLIARSLLDDHSDSLQAALLSNGLAVIN